MEGTRFFGGRKKGRVLGRCAIGHFLGDLDERNRRDFEDGKGEEPGNLWERVFFLASVWASVSSEVREGCFFYWACYFF